MTIIIGTKTRYQGIDTVILGADGAMGYYEKETLTRIRPSSKFMYREGFPLIFAYSGTVTKAYYAFRRDINGTKTAAARTEKTLTKIIERNTYKTFEPLAKMMEDEKDEFPDDPPSTFILGALINGNPTLGKFNSRGSLQNMETSDENSSQFICRGSGDKFATGILRGMNTSLSPSAAARYVIGGLRLAQDRKQRNRGYVKGTHCSGYQLAVITPSCFKVSPLFCQQQFGSFGDYCVRLFRKIERQLQEKQEFANYIFKSADHSWGGRRLLSETAQ